MFFGFLSFKYIGQDSQMTFEAKLIAEYLHGLVAIANDHHFIDVPKSLLYSDTP